MNTFRRPFYIIGHNPNTIEEAAAFLDKGANGLEPDIVYAEGKYYVSHQPQLSYEGTPTVQDYLQDLKTLLRAHSYNLAMMIWDLKTTDFDPNEFMKLVKENFSGEYFDGVMMLMTHSDDHDFINQYRGNYPNVGIGVDESNVSPLELQQIFKAGGQKNISYADGITTFLNKSGVFKNIMDAQNCRHQYEPESFGFIYTWVLSQEASLRKYLNTYIDGIMVDAGSVEKLARLIATSPYNNSYVLAQSKYNPFSAAIVPRYILEVRTADKALAGTNADVVFTLTGATGRSLKSLPYNASTPEELERGTTTWIRIEGNDIGEIKSLTVQLLTGGPGSDWLPEMISVTSTLLQNKVDFYFNAGEEWVTKAAGPVTKFLQ
ncbi:MAG: PLAT/LH2 domain-containing protein [Chitinophagaceae bacterium]